MDVDTIALGVLVLLNFALCGFLTWLVDRNVRLLLEIRRQSEAVSSLVTRMIPAMSREERESTLSQLHESELRVILDALKNSRGTSQ